MKKTGQKIIIADDEEKLRRLLCDYLKKEGYKPIPSDNGRSALEVFYANQDVNLAIIDVMMPEIDGWSVCREIRKISSVPIIMLTARVEESDEIFGFNLGADEYIKKPFSPSVLVARVRALLRRASEGNESLQYGLLSIDMIKRIVKINGADLQLSPKEYDLLVYLANHAGAALNRDQILSSVWDINYYGDGRTVDTHIKRLREKIRDSLCEIETLRGYGYRFKEKNENPQ